MTDNETGETLHDYDTNCIIGAINQGETTACIGMCRECTGGDLVNTMIGVRSIVREFEKGDPKLHLLVEIGERTEAEVAP